MEQKGFKGTGLNVSVDVAPRQVNLIMWGGLISGIFIILRKISKGWI
jgi:hypothetical protein